MNPQSPTSQESRENQAACTRGVHGDSALTKATTGMFVLGVESAIVELDGISAECAPMGPGRDDRPPELQASAAAPSPLSSRPTAFPTGERHALVNFPDFRPYQRVTAYVLGDVPALVDRLRLKPVSSGANVTLIEPYDEGVLYGATEVERAPVVSPVQLYLDLAQTKGRGEEAASAILEEAIKVP